MTVYRADDRGNYKKVEIEAELDRSEQGDESDWVTAEEFDIELRKEFPWLR